ncbi:MAG: glycerol-3-phosphate dehydrogenase/oxidase [Rhodothermales bacterium]
MNRDAALARLADTDRWDIIVIGGGATGLGIAVEAATRGYETLLLEQSDFAKGTSSRSTKLVHGGVRYLQQGNVALVLEALRERGRLLRNAAHLVHDLPFVVPNYDWWEGPFYGIGMKVYDLLAGRSGFPTSSHLSREETLERLPTIEPEGLRGGVIYYDGQFDDARLAINLAQTAADHGAALLTYAEVKGLTKHNEVVSGVIVHDVENDTEHEIQGRVIINATGVFTDRIRRMDDPTVRPMVQPSQGVHLVFDRSFLPGDSAIMVPRTDDGRVLFAIPWHNRVVVGTTDTPVEAPLLEPRAYPDEVAFILEHAARYLTKDPTKADIKSVFAGLRPLVSANPDGDTAAISRDHTLHIAHTGLVTITGGKWTTYRQMAEETVDKAAVIAQLDERPTMTKDLPLHGCADPDSLNTYGHLAVYGSDFPAVEQTLHGGEGWNELLHENLPYYAGEVVWATRNEMARTVEDVLSRRTRALLLDASASLDAAPTVARLMADVLGRDEAWVTEQVKAYTRVATGYLG